MFRTFPSVLLGALLSFAAAAEEPPGTLLVRVRSGAAPVPAAEIVADGVLGTTNERGETSLVLPAGPHTLTVGRAGFARATVAVVVPAGGDTAVTVQLQEVRVEEEVVVVTATKGGRIVEDQPIRVEALPQEEIEENLTIAPGNLTTLLNEIGGVHLQTTSPSLGGAGLRLRGLRGRYTQVVLDELPIWGERPDAFALLQVPPLDLARVEVLKGASSALYGGGALGGVVNLVSRLPGGDPELIVNRTSRGGTDAVGFASRSLGEGRGWTLLGGGHGQSREDVDGDGWTDLPGYWRTELRPRFFRDDGAGHSLFLTLGASVEEREGGTVDGAVTPEGSPFRERLHTERLDTGLVGRFLLPTQQLVTIRGCVVQTRHDRVFGEDLNRDARSFALGEATLGGSDRGHTWLVGAAIQRDAYRSKDLPSFDYTHLVPAVFAQDDYAFGAHLGVSAGARLDLDDEHGAVLSPLVAGLWRPGGGWNVRVSAGAGYASPTPFTDDTEVVGLWRVLPLRDVEPERAKTASLDVGWSRKGLELDASLFASEVRHPLALREASGSPGAFEIANLPGPTRTSGAELLARITAGESSLIATYTALHATEVDATGASRGDVPLTPRHAGELAWIWELESRGRVGVELAYTGTQSVDHDPYRDSSPAYFEWSALAEIRFGEARVFVNAINVTNVRQTTWDPLPLPAREPDGRWTTDVWAPLDGRVFNAGVRVEF